MHSISQRKAHFLLRIPASVARLPRRVITLGPEDWLVEFRPSAASRYKHPELPELLTYRLIRYQIPGFRPSWLLTSLLDPCAFPAIELVELYHVRWRIETIYNEWKHTLDIQNLRSHSPVGIRKEIHAHLLLSNLVRWVMTDAAQGTPLTPVAFSFRTALNLIHNACLKMLRAQPSQRVQIYQDLLQEIRRAPIRVRPGRSYPRPGDQTKNKGHGKRTLSARLNSLT